MTSIAPYVLHAPVATALPLVLDSPHSGEHYPDDFDHAPPRCGRAPRRGHPRRAALSRRAAVRRDADRGRLSARLHRRQSQPRRPRSRDARGSVAGAARARRARPQQGIGLLVAGRARRRADVHAQADGRRSAIGASTTGTVRTTRRSTTRSTNLHRSVRRRSGTSTAIRCRPSATRMPTIRAARARTSFSATATARRARRDSRRSSRETLRGLGYSVAINDPYKGVEIVRRHGRPARGRHSLQIELNRRLYMDEDDARAQLELSRSKAISSGCSTLRSADELLGGRVAKSAHGAG